MINPLADVHGRMRDYRKWKPAGGNRARGAPAHILGLIALPKAKDSIAHNEHSRGGFIVFHFRCTIRHRSALVAGLVHFSW